MRVPGSLDPGTLRVNPDTLRVIRGARPVIRLHCPGREGAYCANGSHRWQYRLVKVWRLVSSGWGGCGVSGGCGNGGPVRREPTKTTRGEDLRCVFSLPSVRLL
jgi:hypothetical protein